VTPGLIRPATPDDVPEILDLIRDLAAYEQALDEVETTQEQLAALLFGGSSEGIAPATHHGLPAASAHVVEHPDAATGARLGGFALWFLTTSTWTGRHGIHLEDLYVRPELRGLGYGRRLLATLAQWCLDHDYHRSVGVLDWNSRRWSSTARWGRCGWTPGSATGSGMPARWPPTGW
jgi:GNAT superfamily N-acetyltransferase